MLLYALILTPAVAGLLAFCIRNNNVRRGLLVLTALVHAGLTWSAWQCRPEPIWQGWLGLDDLSLVFLGITSLLFLMCSIYGIGYLAGETHAQGHRQEEGFIFNNAPEAVFTGCLLLFLSTMTLVDLSRHFGLLWVAVEATTLASAPLIYFHRHRRSLEAVWKYLLICSVGIALALLGNFFLAVAGRGIESGSLSLSSLLAQASVLNQPWLKASFVLLFVGYGTKIGLAPLHTWLPDAHSEAPSMVSALLSGSLLNCALLAILRAQQVCAAAGLETFGQDLFLLFGLLSIALATVFIVRQSDYKRLLAYSSVENMGIISLGLGVGGAGTFGALLQVINHSMTKTALFLLAGNLLGVYATKTVKHVTGAFRIVPRTAFLWVMAFFAIAGSPPFGTFLSKFTILKAGLDSGQYLASGLFILMIVGIFMGMAAIVLRMAFGVPDVEGVPGLQSKTWPLKERLSRWLPPLLLLLLVLLMGVYIPEPLNHLVESAAGALRGEP
jgi:hydrogenase-4 component F